MMREDRRWRRLRCRPGTANGWWKKPWLSYYSPQVKAEIDLSALKPLDAMLRDSFAKFANRTAFTSLGASITYADLKRDSEGGDGGVAGARLQAGRSHRHHDAERYGLSGRALRSSPRRLYGGRRKPALHGARAPASDEGCRRQGDHRFGKLRSRRRAGERGAQISTSSSWQSPAIVSGSRV